MVVFDNSMSAISTISRSAYIIIVIYHSFKHVLAHVFK